MGPRLVPPLRIEVFFAFALGCGIRRRSGRTFQGIQPMNRLFPAGTAHFCRRLQPAAKCRPFRLAEDEAQVVVRKLDAPDACRLPVRHPWNRAGYGWGGTAGPTVVATVHAVPLIGSRLGVGMPGIGQVIGAFMPSVYPPPTTTSHCATTSAGGRSPSRRRFFPAPPFPAQRT